MEHIKQNNKNCLKIIQAVGCFFRSCGLIAEYETGKSLTVRQINDLWHWSKKNGMIDANNNVVYSAPIISKALEVLGGKGHYIEVGLFKDGEIQYYKSISQRYRHIDALIQKINQSGPSVTHFRPVDKQGNVIEDPHDPPIKANYIYYSILYCHIGV